MQAFLAKIGQALLIPALDWLYRKVMDAISIYIKYKRAKAEIEEINRLAKERTLKAETPGERDDAAQNVINNF